jgi:hypothetical protein
MAGIGPIAQLNKETGMFDGETKDTPIVKKNPNVVEADFIYLRGGTCVKYEAVGTLEVNGVCSLWLPQPLTRSKGHEQKHLMITQTLHCK